MKESQQKMMGKILTGKEQESLSSRNDEEDEG